MIVIRYKTLIYFLIFIVLGGCYNQVNTASLESNVPPLSDPDHEIIADNFKLLDEKGISHELYYYSDQKAIILIWQGNGCPIVRQSIPTINNLKDEYEAKKVVFFMVNANTHDDRFEIVKEAEEFNMHVPILEDKAQIVTESFQITRTAEAIVINPEDWRVVYKGAIDDRLGYESQKREVQHNYLQDAIEAVIIGMPVPTPRTQVKGCLINLESAYSEKAPTYTQDIAPILQKKCLLCHYQGGVAPWIMSGYETIRGWGPMIREVVRTKRMPPWNPDSYYGHFKNDITLTSQDIQMLVHWVERGLLKGEGEDPLIKIDHSKKNNWQLGQPDIILTVKEVQHIPAKGVLPYYYIESDKSLDEDIWTRAIEIRPSNRRVVHHIRAGILRPGNEDRDYHSPNFIKDNYFSSYVPGKEPDMFEENTGRFIPKGAKILFELHYVPNGRPEIDRTEIGIYKHDRRPEKEVLLELIANNIFIIPPGTKGYRHTASYTFPKAVFIDSLRPHMHYRGRSMKFTAEYPDGKSEILLSVPDYQFQWQHAYAFREKKYLSAGTTLRIDGLFDNSIQNSLNPNPNQEIHYGLRTIDEMFVGVVQYTIIENE